MVKLRPLCINDLPFLLEVRNDDSTREFLENNSVFTLSECKEWFLKTNPKWYIIEDNQTPVGYLRTNEDEVGCDIHPNFRKKGYARAAYKMYLQDKNYASLWVFKDNFAINLYKSLGFTPNENTKLVRGKPYLQMEWNSLKILILLFYYERPQMVLNALDSIKECGYNNYHVAFIDDNSQENGEVIAKQFLSPKELSKFTFYNTNQLLEDKEKQESIFGKLANQAMNEVDSDITLMLCDDDALIPGYLSTLNVFFTFNSEVNHCYSNLLFYDPKVGSYKDAREDTEFRSSLAMRYNKHTSPINPYTKQLDASQVAWRSSCNIEFPFPRTRGLDAIVYRQLHKDYGLCYPTKTFGQYKGWFDDQLGNRRTNLYNTRIK